MTIYISHPIGIDFKHELYIPLRNSELNKKHTFIFPHETSDKPYKTKDLLVSGRCDLVIAECSVPSTGQRIELGWADFYKVPILCIYKKGKSGSAALKVVTDYFLEYAKPDNMIIAIAKFLSERNK